VTWTLTPDPPRVGPARLVVRLADGGQPVRGARVSVEASMSHPGMRPVLADLIEHPGGSYEGSLSFTMGGAWFVLVSGSLSDGRRVAHRIDLPHVRSSR
jgi:hypothetical protein